LGSAIPNSKLVSAKVRLRRTFAETSFAGLHARGRATLQNRFEFGIAALGYFSTTIYRVWVLNWY
jgi:hypothetical protein